MSARSLIAVMALSSGLVGCGPGVPVQEPAEEVTRGSALVGAAALTCDVKAFGARGDGVTKDTVALQRAIDTCATSAGSTVWLHDGVFLSGTIVLRSNLTLRIDASATLKGTMVDSDYPTLYVATGNTQLVDARKALVFIYQSTGVKLTGAGTIDGSGTNPNWVGEEATRPMAIFAALSNGVTVEGVRVKDAGMWAVVALESDNVTFTGLDIRSYVGPNRDGIDLVDCHGVLVDGVTVYSGDDAIVLKSGSARGVNGVTVRNSTVLGTGSNALKLGSASTGYFYNVTFSRITVQNTAKAAMAVMTVDGAWIDTIVFNDITVSNVAAPFFVLRGRRAFPPSPSVGTLKNVRFENVRGTAYGAWGSAISGQKELFGIRTVDSIFFTNVNLTNLTPFYTATQPPEYYGQYPDPPMWGNMPAYGLYARHVRGLYLNNVTFNRAAQEWRPEIYLSDVAGYYRW